jgi:hypothetical protein
MPVGFIKKKFFTMDGHMNVNVRRRMYRCRLKVLYGVIALSSYVSPSNLYKPNSITTKP